MPQNALHVGTAAVISGILGAQSYCSLNGNDAHSGSVKACFGHTEGAAGIHGALLAIFAVQKRLAPAIMHMRGNEHLCQRCYLRLGGHKQPQCCSSEGALTHLQLTAS